MRPSGDNVGRVCMEQARLCLNGFSKLMHKIIIGPNTLVAV